MGVISLRILFLVERDEGIFIEICENFISYRFLDLILEDAVLILRIHSLVYLFRSYAELLGEELYRLSTESVG